MKKFYSLVLTILSLSLFAQVPTGYYDGTAGLTGYNLKTKLSQIITNGHRDNGYNALYSGYESTDTDKYYENDGTVLDMYSENPAGADPYNYVHGSKKCGSYNSEFDCYNREHIVPQSTFGEKAPMVSDIHHIPPTDGYVNNRRSNYPFGEVNSATWTSLNGSKVGTNSTPGYSGTVFEPIDEFKGDVARMIFYFATRYQNQIPGFTSGTILDGTTTRSISQWELDILLAWHAADPVSQREIDRNNAAYTYQGNRNPFIDNPSWVTTIWTATSTAPDTEAPSTPLNVAVSNIAGTTATVSWTASTDNIGVTGYNIYINGVLAANSGINSVNLGGLSQQTTYTVTIEAVDGKGNKSQLSAPVNFTTTNEPPTEVGATCGNETFETIPASASSYSSRTWTANGITWTATDARTSENLNGRAITVRNGSLKSSAISGGIGSLTISTQQEFSGSAGTFDLIVNGTVVGSIPYTASENGVDAPITTTTVTEINIAGNIVIELVNKNTGTRVSLDDLSWTCYSSLATNENPSTKNQKLSVAPNPVRNGQLAILGLDGNNVRVEIFNMTGQLVQVVEKASKANNKIALRNLAKGIYILKAGNQATKFIVE